MPSTYSILKPTPYAVLTANTLNEGAVTQIIKFLNSTIVADQVGVPRLTPKEREVLGQAVDSLTQILSWQTPRG